EVGLPGPGRAADGEVLGAADPFQGRQRGLGRDGDGGVVLAPGGEGLSGREAGGLAAHGLGGLVAAADLLGEQDAQDLGGVPALGSGGGQDLGGGGAQVGHPHAPQDRGQVLRQRRRGRLRGRGG